MTKIELMIREYIRDTGLAQIVEQDDQPGVLFLDEMGWIPFDDLGYNATYGFFQKSLFPDVKDEATE